MKDVKSLKQRVSEISVYAFICITVLMFTCFTLYSIKKSKVTEENIQADLTLNLMNQVILFLPSYLLPEQKQGVELILAKIKNDENLEDIRIIRNQNEIPPSFKNCRLNDKVNITCPSSDMSLTAVIAPLREMDEVYGYILKSKKNSSATNLNSLIQFAGIALFLIALTFIGIYYQISKLISKTLPNSMDQLVKWIE